MTDNDTPPLCECCNEQRATWCEGGTGYMFLCDDCRAVALSARRHL